ncbi:MAG: hypothetical protein K2K31_03010 [Clostridia bacterium]|nr:hypothetical protein [Clostridia bacterium]
MEKQESVMVMSILTYYANQIFDGTKLYEFRKSPLKSSDLNRDILIYSAKGDKAIIGSFKVKEILHGDINEILKLTGYDKRSDGHEIVEYFGQKNNCYALKLYDVKRFKKPITLKELRSVNPKLQLPQYYAYIKSSDPIYSFILEKIL